MPPPRDGRSGPPAARPQLEELRSGKWVTEPVARGRHAATGPARLAPGGFVNNAS
jgi:hypothetical protein